MNSGTPITYQKWAPSTWVESIKKFLSTMDAEIQIPNTIYPQAQREFDVSLMKTFQNQYTGTKILAQLNRCRIWLGVITLSDITDASGHALCPYAASGFRHPQRPSVYTWRNQSIMNNKSWRTWKSCVKNTFTHNGKHIKRPLGNWLQTAPSQHW